MNMRRIITALVAALLCLSAVARGAQNTNAPAAGGAAASKKRAPIFRATKEQIKQAQALLKGRSLYDGEASGKLDDGTRAALRKFQEAEGLKVTGTLNAVTLQKMSIPLTDRQKEVVAAQSQKQT
jgi:peptidoglycan hydrolase-like protein with peptidoglycan-binding domain